MYGRKKNNLTQGRRDQNRDGKKMLKQLTNDLKHGRTPTTAKNDSCRPKSLNE